MKFLLIFFLILALLMALNIIFLAVIYANYINNEIKKLNK